VILERAHVLPAGAGGGDEILVPVGACDELAEDGEELSAVAVAVAEAAGGFGTGAVSTVLRSSVFFTSIGASRMQTRLVIFSQCAVNASWEAGSL
jgi:hypothetical protein